MLESSADSPQHWRIEAPLSRSPPILAMGKTILIAVDDSPTSQNAALFGINLAKPGDEVRLIAVCPPPSYAMTPAAPIASAGAVRGCLRLCWGL